MARHGYAPRFGMAYDLTGRQKFVLRGGAGLFFDRPSGNSVFSQVGNPPFSTLDTVGTRSCRRWQRRADDSGAARADRLRVRLGAAVVHQWNAGMQIALPWSFAADI